MVIIKLREQYIKLELLKLKNRVALVSSVQDLRVLYAEYCKLNIFLMNNISNYEVDYELFSNDFGNCYTYALGLDCPDVFYKKFEEFEKGYGRYFYVYGTEIERSLSYVDPECGWFKRGGYQFVVRGSAEKYFRKTRKKHIFEYNYTPILVLPGEALTAYPYDPPMWGMAMEKDKCHIAFLPYNPNTEPKDKAAKP